MYRSYIHWCKSEANKRNRYFYKEGQLCELFEGCFSFEGAGVNDITEPWMAATLFLSH